MTMVGSCLIAVVFLMLDVKNVYWDVFFLFGLVVFMVGGVLLLLKKGIFDFFFYSFNKFLKSSSKVEQYVSEVNNHNEFATSSSKNAAIPHAVLFAGISIIIITTVFPVYLL
ncbi:DUF3899 domain-containing protein [Sporosarcina sp. Sa3CUA8]|uniref:DUF3899 domain-containing protein n=1 Tax=Sporosarcina gallistercoris TaxID=2762245 RepID=A0ABR8PLK0_9BACL|nr:DUF3899 domain-containing protein [Sporosarcina gallistercoris]